ncbi:hypothetical protein ACXR0O_15505 [Verrucomicrobiota bacterium sgz303538]
MLLIAAAIFCCVAHTEAEEGKELPPGSVKIIFFVPSDLAVPEGVRDRITKISDAADAFFFNGMSRQGYPPEVKTLFRREADGQVELLHVRGDEPVASGKYSQPNCIGYVVNKAIKQHNVPEARYVWWVFMYLGDRPTRFENWAGRGNPRDGGWAIINYDTVPGDIRPDLQLTEGFNFEYKLKSTIHELAHGFGLPHMGPDPTLDMGNSLMGPNPPEYAARRGPKADHVYLAASEAAMLWKHPFFTGKAMERFEPSELKLADYKAVFDPGADTVTVSGKLIAKQSAHSVVLIDDRGDKRATSEYWSRSYAARLAPDGSFQIRLNDPAKVDGEYRILFCLENGIVTGNGTNIGPVTRGDIRKTYRFSDGQFIFQE